MTIIVVHTFDIAKHYCTTFEEVFSVLIFMFTSLRCNSTVTVAHTGSVVDMDASLVHLREATTPTMIILSHNYKLV